MSVSDTVLDLSVDGNVWSSGGLSSSWCSGLLADGDSPGLDSTVTQSNDLSSDLVGWCIGGWSRSYLHGSGGSLSLANWLNGDEDLGTVVSSWDCDSTVNNVSGNCVDDSVGTSGHGSNSWTETLTVRCQSGLQSSR